MSRKTAIAIIDYDNINDRYRRNHIALEQELYCQISKIDIFDEIKLRIYGGWFEQRNPSVSAQALAPWIGQFPKAIQKTMLSAELARSLAFERRLLPYTFRKRTRSTLVTVDPRQIHKHDNSCDIFKLQELLSKERCSSPFCGKQFKDALLVNEQKLTDTMICTDLIYFAQNTDWPIILVSSDDDFVPALRMIKSQNKTVYVLHTMHEGYRYKSEYVDNNCEHIIQEGMHV